MITVDLADEAVRARIMLEIQAVIAYPRKAWRITR